MKITQLLFSFLLTLAIVSSTEAQIRKAEDMDISDADRDQTNSINEEYSKLKLQQLCAAQEFEDDDVTAVAGDISRICLGEESEGLFGISESTMQMATKAYNQFIAFLSTHGIMEKLAGKAKEEKKPSGTEGKADSTNEKQPDADKGTEKSGEKPKSDNPADANNDKNAKADGEEKEEFFDVCGFIGGGVETVSAFQQQSYQEHLNSIPIPEDNAQTESLHKIKRDYREKSQNNGRNSIGWGATTTCYAASFATSPPTGWGIAGRLLKTAAAGFLTAFNNSLADANENAARAITKVIQQMPGKGDCNPITQRNCFCNLPSNLNNAKYCMPEIRARLKRSYGTQVVCLDRFRRPDDDCSCIARNDCFDQTFMRSMDGLEFGKSFEDLNQKNVRAISRGTLGRSDGQLGQLSNNALKTAKRALRSVPLNKAPRPKRISKEQLEQINEAEALGIPKTLAALVAGQKQGSKKLLSSLGRSGGYRSSYNRSKSKNRSRNLRLSGGSGSVKNNFGKKNKNAGYTKPRLGAGSGQKVQRFAEKASSRASIVNKPSVSIFKIISVRYQKTKKRRLE